MPLESSRRLLSGGRYSPLPPLLEDDYHHVSTRNGVATTTATTYGGRQGSPPTGSQRHITPLHNGYRTIVFNGSNGISSRQPWQQVHDNGRRSRGGGCETNGSPTHNGHGNGPTTVVPVHRGYSASSSSLIHTDGAVVPQVQPHGFHAPATHSTPTEVRLWQGRPCVRAVQVPARPERMKSPLAQRWKGSFTKIPPASPPSPPIRPPRPRGGGLLRAVVARGRGYRYQNLQSFQEKDAPVTTIDTSDESTVSGGEDCDPTPSPPYTPPPRSPHPGILINSAMAKQGIKRLTRLVRIRP